MLSVLPEHVAVKMRQDLGSNDSEQFKKIYMSRHENVRYKYTIKILISCSTHNNNNKIKIIKGNKNVERATRIQ